MAGKTYRFGPRQQDEMLMNIENNDMDMDVFRNVGTENMGKNHARAKANSPPTWERFKS